MLLSIIRWMTQRSQQAWLCLGLCLFCWRHGHENRVFEALGYIMTTRIWIDCLVPVVMDSVQVRGSLIISNFPDLPSRPVSFSKMFSVLFGGKGTIWHCFVLPVSPLLQEQDGFPLVFLTVWKNTANLLRDSQMSGLWHHKLWFSTPTSSSQVLETVNRRKCWGWPVWALRTGWSKAATFRDLIQRQGWIRAHFLLSDFSSMKRTGKEDHLCLFLQECVLSYIWGTKEWLEGSCNSIFGISSCSDLILWHYAVYDACN